LTFFDWGQYAIWHFAPELKVSMDGRRETVYSDDMIWAHWRFYDAEASALPFLEQLNPDYVWVPKRRAINNRLAGAGWTSIFDGPVSTIFARQAPLVLHEIDPVPAGPRCFPGP
jgi:hypothetical protein